MSGRHEDTGQRLPRIYKAVPVHPRCPERLARELALHAAGVVGLGVQLLDRPGDEDLNGQPEDDTGAADSGTVAVVDASTVATAHPLPKTVSIETIDPLLPVDFERHGEKLDQLARLVVDLAGALN